MSQIHGSPSVATGFVRLPATKGAEDAPKTAIAYIRVSTDKQELGPEAQSDAIAKWCDDNGICLLGEHREVCSGAMPISRRDIFLKAVRESEENAVDFFIVAKRDRLARDVVQAGVAEQMVASIGARLISVDDPAGQRLGPEAHLIRVIFDAVAEFERARIAMRIREAMAIKRRNGERIGAVPFGMTVAADKVSLIDDEKEKEIIAMAVNLRRRGLGLRAIGTALTQAGYTTRAGNEFRSVQVQRIIERYAPEIEAARRAERSSIVGGKLKGTTPWGD